METGMRVGLSAQIEGGTAGGAPCSERPWLSILIPVYNVEPYLRDCLASLLPQLPPVGVEAILLDDASTDGSLGLCSEICPQSHPQVRLMRHPSNAGLSAARNTMLDAARGDYIWFVDSDDEVMPGAIARLRAIIDRDAPDLVLCDYERGGRHLSSFAGPSGRPSADREALLQGVFARRRLHSWSKIARRSLWGDDLRFPAGRCFEDIATTPWLLLRARTHYHAAEAWVRYRDRPDSIMGALRRSRGRFDDCRNDDLAMSLAGFDAATRDALPAMSDVTRHHIAHFWAKEFTKICWRLLSSSAFRMPWRDLRRKLARYRGMMDAESPIAFATLARLYRSRGRLPRAVILSACLWLAQADDAG